jgi:hypothetical protein
MQQIPFIDLFKSALHDSGDKFGHPQEHFWLYMQLLVQCTYSAADRWHGWDGSQFYLNRQIRPSSGAFLIVYTAFGTMHRHCCRNGDTVEVDLSSISTDKFAHPQEHFWLYMQLWYNAPTLMPTSDKVEMELSSISTVSVVGSRVNAVYQSCIYSQKCSWGWANLSP